MDEAVGRAEAWVKSASGCMRGGRKGIESSPTAIALRFLQALEEDVRAWPSIVDRHAMTVAATVRVAVPPAAMVWLCGCAVIDSVSLGAVGPDEQADTTTSAAIAVASGAKRFWRCLATIDSPCPSTVPTRKNVQPGLLYRSTEGASGGRITGVRLE